ncbi:uncharacterized protein LOC141588110 [Silene latifolia]|uniref:uncharacterized protein LOC141588110 n=1 Tax=Silene latifolia TaxID=37657 RepID=UPI003D76BD5E
MIKFGFWNVRGMNKGGKQVDVNNFLHNNNVGMFGLLETKIKTDNFHSIANKIFSDWSISTNNNFRSGGRVWMLWKSHMFDIQFLQYDAQFIHMHVVNKIDQMQFFQTIVYAFNGVGERESLWLNLKSIAQQINGPWIIGGDFNCVLQTNERLGGNVSIAESEPFYDCLQDCGLMDLAATRAFYTWNNKQPPATKIYSRLDRLFVNHEWNVSCPDFLANFLPEGLFDHTPCLEQLTLSPGDENLVQQEYEAHQVSASLQKAKLAFLKQKAKAHWLKDGDANTAYFHGVIKARRNKHFICQITDHLNKTHTNQEGIQSAFLNYYEMLLVSKATTTRVNRSIVNKGRIWNEAHKTALLAHVSKDEIKNIIFHIPDDKAPGPDGYSSKFYKDSWDIIGDEVTAAIMDFFDSGQILRQINNTMITLIPKVDRPISVLQ